jgi:6-phosphogluconolactonase
MSNDTIALVFQDKQKLVHGLTEHFVKLCRQRSAPLHIALSGGSTPKTWFDYLAGMPTKAIDWGKIHLYWVDERCVPPDDPESNFGMTRKHLLDQVPLPTENIHRIAGELEPSEAANQYEEMLKNTLGAAPVFDLLMLGMGNDGHTASIFPHQIALWHSERLCVVATHPESGQMRVSLTGKVINNAASVAFLVAVRTSKTR